MAELPEQDAAMGVYRRLTRGEAKKFTPVAGA